MMRAAWTRAVVAGFWIPTAIYCLISAIPFTWEQFLKWQYMPGLKAFAAWHPWISLAVLAVAGAGLAPWLRAGHRGARAFIAACAAAAVAMLIAPPLATLEPSVTAFALTLFALVPPTWMSLLNLSPPRSAHAAVDEGAGDVFRDFVACGLSALVVTSIYAVAALPMVLPYGAGSAGLQLLRSLLLHFVVFSVVFAVLCVIRGAARLISARPVAEEMLARCALACLLSLFVFRIVLRPLSLVGLPAAIVATGFGAGLATMLGPRTTRAAPGLDRALSGLFPAWAARSAAAAGGWLAAVGIAMLVFARAVSVSDWNFTIAKLMAVMSWLLVLAIALRVTRSRLRVPSPLPFVTCLAVLGLNQVASRAVAGPPAVIDAWMARDPSVRLIADALAPKAVVSDERLGDFLQLHTNIPHSTVIEPVAIDLARLEGAPSPNRPDIYLFVIDSLRRDYLSPYNPRVEFTPALGQFARESTVFERAFTRYGATGLSVPALWIGGLTLHKQYVTPFAPMNTLAKLLEHEQYEQWLAMDAILDVILPASEQRRPLEAAPGVRDDRFCSAVGEIRRRIGARKPGAPPAFAYALPQDIHVSTIAREGAASVDKESYGAFYAPYASRLRRIDTCFGEFIADLKARGLFDRSIVILTADHGDSLGEQGRMGHAYTIFPEILQVPLIVHLPSELRARLHADPSATVFNTDVTPTLYALLGHDPRQPASFFGRPLFREALAPAARPSAEPVMVGSSYGTVYGALLDDARRLYIIDGIAFREYAYDLDGTGAGRVTPVTADDRARSQRAIRGTVEGIAEFYGYHPGVQRPQ